MRRAEARYATRFDDVVYVADACYDAQAAQRLGFSFVGVGPAERHLRLRACGAKVIVPDLTHLASAIPQARVGFG